MAKASEEFRIATERLILRDFREDDLPEIHLLRSHPETTRHMNFRPERLERTRDWLAEMIFYTRQRPRIDHNLAIVFPEEDRPIGWIGIIQSGRGREGQELEFGYMLRREYWGHGYMGEAARAILDFGFGTLGGRRISAWCYAENLASIRVLERAGLRLVREYEGFDPRHGEPILCRSYAISAEEWASASPAAP